MDSKLCDLQATFVKTQALRSRPLRVRLGMVTAMAKIIEYYRPERFRKTTRWIPPDQRGKIIVFPGPALTARAAG